VVDTLELAVSPTGTAGLAGVMAVRDELADDAKVLVVHSGVLRRAG
jgi:hypothetical protein